MQVHVRAAAEYSTVAAVEAGHSSELSDFVYIAAPCGMYLAGWAETIPRDLYILRHLTWDEARSHGKGRPVLGRIPSWQTAEEPCRRGLACFLRIGGSERSGTTFDPCC